LIEKAVFSEDGGMLAASGREWTFVWDLASKRVLHRFESHGYVFGIAFHSDSMHLAVSVDAAIYLYDLKIGLEDTLPMMDATASALTFSQDGYLIACGTMDGIVMVWDVGTRTQLLSDQVSAGSISAITFNPSSSRLFAVDDCHLYTRQIEDGAVLERSSRRLIGA
jgi:WD40 repeat protein